MNFVRLYTYTINIILILAFFEGGFTFIGIGEPITRSIREILILLLFITTFIYKKNDNISINNTYFSSSNYVKPLKIKINTIFIILGSLVVASFIINNNSPVELFLYFRRIFIPLIFFYTLTRVNFLYNSVLKTLIYLVLCQLPFIVIKFFVLGISESGAIGSISIHSGSLSAIFPLCVISFLYSQYLFEKKYIKLFLILCFLLFGLIGGKRVLFIFFPILLIMMPIFYNTVYLKRKISSTFIRNLLFSIFLALFSFYLIVRLSPSLNKENSIWGGFNYQYVIDLSKKYNTATYEKGFSRLDAPYVVFDLLNKKGGIKSLLVGLGPGDIIQSSLNNYSGVTNDRQLLLKKYGIGYGARSGFLWNLIQVGLIGSLSYLMIFVLFFKYFATILKFSNNKMLNKMALGLMGATLILIIEYISYSSVFINIGAISNTYFLLSAIIFTIYKKEYLHLNNENFTRNK